MNHWKINLIILVTVVSASTLIMLISGIRIVKDLKVKQVQINVLIDEVGNLKSGGTEATIIKEKTETRLTPLAKQITQNIEPTKAASDITSITTTSYLLVGQHSGLTDSIIVAVLNEKDKEITLISIPRDLAINGRKINEFYELFGIQKLAEEIQMVTDIELDKFVIVDMKAFTQFIDAIGGIDVNVEKPIHDYQYPKNRIEYQIFSIGAGWHHMDGQLALKYARSRKSTSDFDRSRRQQQVIGAARDRLAAGDFYNILSNLYDNLTKNIETNISFLEAITLLSETSDYTMKTNHMLETANLLYPTYNKQGQWILLPKTGNFTEIHEQVEAWIAE